MVKFSITFVLSLPRTEEKQKKKEKKIKIDNVNTGEEEIQTKYEVGKPAACFHIEYFLTSDANKFEVDINCWENAAKVYIKDQTKILKTVLKDGITWIVFSVTHTLTLSRQELENLLTYKAKFCIYDSKKRLGDRAKDDSPKVFYRAVAIKERSLGEVMYEQLYSSAESTQTAIREVTELSEHEVIKLFALPVNQHTEYTQRLIQNFRIDEKPQVPALDLKQKMEEKYPKGKAKKGKGVSPKLLQDKDKKTASGFSFTIDTKMFFTDIVRIIGEVKPMASALTYASAVVSVKQLMSDEQIEKYNPFIIRISELRNLPHEILREKSITSVLIRYKILDVEFETHQHTVKRDIMFNSTNVILTNYFSPIKFIQFLQTGQMIVELVGIPEPQEHKVKPSVFGQESYDCQLSRQLISTSPEVFCLSMLKELPVVVLATATYVLTGLLMGYNLNDLCVNLQATNRLNLQKDNGNRNFITMDYMLKSQPQTPFTNSMLLENDTCLNVTFKVMAPLKPMLHRVQLDSDILNRIFMIIYNHDKAKEIITNIYEINQTVLGLTTIAPDFEKTKANTFNATMSQATIAFLELPENRERSEYVRAMVDASSSKMSSGTSSPTLNTSDIDSLKDEALFYMRKALTGFVIDSFDKIIIFVEGVSNGPLQYVWNNVMSLPRSMGQVHYNSDLVFESRLYSEFISYGGLHIITLRVPLDIYLVNPRAFIEGNMPRPCWNV